ncbi:olfactory receptor 2AP1-like [Rhinophrynus dorsalis]
MVNNSEIFEFVLVGFPGLPQKFEILVSTVMFIVYNLALYANSTVIGLIIIKQNLHHPMYFFIGNLAVSDVVFDTITLPKIIAKYWFGDEAISFAGCFFQFFFVHYLGTVDSFIIMLMAVDRYVAICKPLRYSAIITHKVTVILCCFFWGLAVVPSAYAPLNAVSLTFCRSNKINNCFCYSSAVYALPCSDVSFIRETILITAMIVLLVPLALIILSYVIIIWTIHSSAISENWQKVFYTCTTHLFVIVLYFVPRVVMYLSSQVNLYIRADMKILILCLYTYLPHIANPIIYCLRNKEIKMILGNVLNRKISTIG